MDKTSFYFSLCDYLSRVEEGDWTPEAYNNMLAQVYYRIVKYVTDQKDIQFTSLFARISFLSSFFQLNGKEAFILHQCRKVLNDPLNTSLEEVNCLLKQGTNVLVKECLQQKPLYPEHLDKIYRKWGKPSEREYHSFISEKVVLILDIDIKEKTIQAQEYEEPFRQLIIKFNRADHNEDYAPIMEKLTGGNHLPLMCNLIDVQVDGRGQLYPSSFVFEPDSLYDVTAISECFGAFGTQELGYLLRRFIDKPPSLPLIIGNLANHFLDQLIFHPAKTFDDVIHEIFHLYPLSLTRFNDNEIKNMLVQLQVHFMNIKKVVNGELKKLGLTRESSYLEPSFYSARYGIQGRLDLFCLKEEKASIVELKSGTPFRPNAYGMGNNHYHQSLLYDMLVESVFTNRVKRSNFLLYSKESSQQLRFAPALRSEQRETLKIRNLCWLHDQSLGKSVDIHSYITTYAGDHSKAVKGFLKTDLKEFDDTLSSLSALERAYFNSSVRFVIREQTLAKLGDDSNERVNGLASLWRDTMETKKDRFSILNHLEIIRNNSNQDDPVIDLEKSALTADLNNFRVGDVGVFYPDLDRRDSILRHQVFKCSVVRISDRHVKIRLRSRQENAEVFRQHQFWHLEHDVLENGFHAMTRSVFSFMKSPPENRRLLLGSQPPALYELVDAQSPNGLTEEQLSIFHQIISMKDYFLLWGPPGTGKTSVLFKEVVRHLMTNGHDRLLLMAYTNRAVDEMCKALESIDPKIKFVRIGSRYSTSVYYKKHLLQEQVRSIPNRRETHTFLTSHRIYIGTVASLMGRADLFELLSFDVAVVDEASQILEPSLVGLLSRVGRFVLIGDHLQLPAVVMQKRTYTGDLDEQLAGLGIRDLSNSLFERMYQRALSKKWGHALGILTHQGRMHSDLMAIPNQLFYQGRLKILPGLSRLSEALSLRFEEDQWSFLNSRLVYIPTDIDVKGHNLKVNEDEARWIVKIVRRIVHAYRQKGQTVESNTIGIMAPFRAQIARITQMFQEIDEEWIDLITVDTVERYQGSARDIVLFSTALNASFQIDNLVSLSDSGVDRKLNVAFTRAREQFILLGNEAILSKNEAYRMIAENAVRPK